MISRLFNELQYRRVFRVVAAYAVAAWIAVGAADIIFPVLGVPNAILTWLIVAALAGIPLVAALAWIFDITSEGVVFGRPAPASKGDLNRLSSLTSWLLVLILAAAVTYLSVRLYSQTDQGPTFSRGKSVAVLPFRNIALDDQASSVYFSDGVAEEILSTLSDVDGLRVAARTSSFAFRDNVDIREVGERLNVSTVLDGSVRMDQETDHVRITAQLAETGGGFQLWSKTFDYEIENVFAVQDEIARAIVRELKLEFSARDTELLRSGTTNVEAYKAYLRGRHYLQLQTVSAIDLAIDNFEQAIGLDPEYAQAYAGLADAWIGKREVGNLSLLTATQRAHDAISTALRLNNELAEAQTSLGLCVLGAGQEQAAASQFAKAIALNPNYADAHLLQANLLRDRGFLQDATPAYSQALALDPISPTILAEQAILFAMQGRFERATEQLEPLLADNPERLPVVIALSKVAGIAGNTNRSVQLAEQARALAPDNPIVLAQLVDAYMQAGRLDAADAALNHARVVAPENETVIKATLRYLLIAERHAELEDLSMQRARFVIDNPALRDAKIRTERLGWGAVGRLSVGDAAGARELIEAALSDSLTLNPHPQSVYYHALLIRAQMLEGADESVIAIALENGWTLADRVRSQGWATGDVDYALAALAASSGARDDALQHLSNAIGHGWRHFLLADQDPALQSLHGVADYHDLMRRAREM